MRSETAEKYQFWPETSGHFIQKKS